MINLTPRAVEAVIRMKKELHLGEDAPLRVGVAGGGCSGFSYDVKFAETVGEKDKVFKLDGLTVVCDSKSLLYLAGLELDYEDTVMHKGFVFHNPNATRTCGCGTSFSVG